ncbi:MAG TPA: hypothetical protein VMF08_18450 [Candidatus Sulfotelmatobacter sp.]|nr:hypothetical protein [Candidatus Sulfotelmatobacter sp.]
MKTTKTIYGITLALTFGLATTLNAQIIVGNAFDNIIGEYGVAGRSLADFRVGFEPAQWHRDLRGRFICRELRSRDHRRVHNFSVPPQQIFINITEIVNVQMELFHLLLV